jgi:hypothetical protein
MRLLEVSTFSPDICIYYFPCFEGFAEARLDICTFFIVRIERVDELDIIKMTTSKCGGGWDKLFCVIH